MMLAGTAKEKKVVQAPGEGSIALHELLGEQADEQPDNVIMVDDSQTNVYTAPMHRT